MLSSATTRPALSPILLSSLALVLLASALAFAQSAGKSPASSAASQDQPKEIVLRGCLSGGADHLGLFAGRDGDYILAGDTSALAKFSGREVILRGVENTATQPYPTFVVSALVEGFDSPVPKLIPEFSDRSQWQSLENSTYGVRFSYPVSPSVTASASTTPINPEEPAAMLPPNFVDADKVVVAGRIDFEGAIYPGTDFHRGSLVIYLGPAITNRESCEQFASSDSPVPAPESARRIKYSGASRGDVGMGHWMRGYQFHTFQHGLCYELAFEFHGTSRFNSPMGCAIAPLREKDFHNVADPLVASVSFFRPEFRAPREAARHEKPQVTSFQASSRVADDVTNRGLITFSWTTRAVDYVELSFRCSVTKGTVIIAFEGGVGPYCENADFRPNSAPDNRPPNSSLAIGFGNYDQLDPITIVATLTPFSRGAPVPGAAQSIPIAVQPHNPFPQGVGAGNGNVTVIYPAALDGTTKCSQGSQLTIRWVDLRPQDPCVDIYLVQETGSGNHAYRAQLGGACLKPSASGSYDWTIPARFSGSGFRIFAFTPGGFSSGIGPPFRIVPAPIPPSSLPSPYPRAQVNRFVEAGNMHEARQYFAAVVLENGLVLVVGGGTLGRAFPAELYDPASDSFRLTGTPAVKRFNFTATRLNDGKVLIVGGYPPALLGTAELYDPATGQFTATGSLIVARYNHTATLLPDGKVLIAGGMTSASSWLSSAELYDPATGSFTPTGSLNLARGMHTATLLAGGQVLIAGGQGLEGKFPAAAELYDPATGLFTLSGELHRPRTYHTATRLQNGMVLIAGGNGESEAETTPTTAELYDPAIGAFRSAGNLNAGRSFHTATLLDDGDVLFAGGIRAGSAGVLASAELYDPRSDTFTLAGSLNTARLAHCAVLLPSGRVLIVGGAGQIVLVSAELY